MLKLTTLIFAGCLAAETWAEQLVLVEAWTRATPPGMTTAAVYGSLVNHRQSEQIVVSVTSESAASAMIHRSEVKDGLVRMVHTRELTIQPGETVGLEPGGLHVMLMGLARPLVSGDIVPLKITLKSGEEIRAEAKVGSIAQLGFPED